MSIDSLVRPNIRAMMPYSSARDEFSGSGSVFLDANENPVETGMNRYPDPYQQEIKKELSDIKGVRTEQIFLGNGSDEPIDLLIRLFCTPGKDSIVSIDPSYGMYKVAAAVNDVKVETVPLRSNFSLDADSVLEAAGDSAKIIFLCSPNNPSGNLLEKGEVKKIVEGFDRIVVIDEAYIDFTNEPGFLPELDNFPNLVVLQTFSKAWGLAGLRVGMAFASPSIITYLNKIKPPYNINTLSQQAVLKALESYDNVQATVQNIIQEREQMQNQLDRLTEVQEVFPSDSNFLLVRLQKATELFETLLSQGIIVRDRSKVLHGENCLRFTVGTSEENQQLINAIKTFYS